VINPLSLLDRTILVTGASSGIGRASAKLLSKLGAKVILVGRNRERLERSAVELEGSGHRTEQFDLAAGDAIVPWVKGLALSAGPLHGIVHCAGAWAALPLRLVTEDQIEKTMRINLLSAVFLAKGFRLKGVHAEGGSMVLLSSVAGLVGQPGITAYSASKGALMAAARSLALELAPEGLRINCIAPGCVQSEMLDAIQKSLSLDQFAAVKAMHPLGFGNTLDVAHAVAFLLADTGRWITGTTLVIDGGYTVH
jgi:3-oxoacyl-[acyl-carrier protein] reductase